jgi:hypothetical protein
MFDFIGLAYQGKDIVFIFIIEYSRLMDFGPYAIGLFLYEFFWKMIFWLVLKLEISYRVIISWRILVSFFRRFFEDYIFVRWNIFEFHNSSFALRYFFNVNGKATVWHTPLLKMSCKWKMICYFQIKWTYCVCYHKAYDRFHEPCKSPKENNEILLQTSNANQPCKHTHTPSYSCSWICNLEKLGTRVGPIHH